MLGVICESSSDDLITEQGQLYTYVGVVFGGFFFFF